MNETIRIDRSGRIVIPRRVREKYGLLEGGYDLEVVEAVDGILLRPTAEEIPAERDLSGWLVFRSDEAETVDPSSAVEAERDRRHRQITDGA